MCDVDRQDLEPLDPPDDPGAHGPECGACALCLGCPEGEREVSGADVQPEQAAEPRDPCDECFMLIDGCIDCEHATGRRGKR